MRTRLSGACPLGPDGVELIALCPETGSPPVESQGERIKELTPLERRVLEAIANLDGDGAKSDLDYLILMTRDEPQETQNLGQALERLQALGLVKRTFLGKYKPTRAGYDLRYSIYWRDY